MLEFVCFFRGISFCQNAGAPAACGFAPGRSADQLCVLTCDFDPKEMGFSPDRGDALVWALTELSENAGGGGRGVFIGI